MIFSLKPGKPLWKEILEQFGHGAYVVILTIGFVTPMPIWQAGFLAMAYYIFRELEQHEWKKIGYMDTAFAAMAVALVVIWLYIKML